MNTIWTVHLLGTLSVQRTGYGLIRLKISKPHLLLARLALHLNREVSKDVLLEMLWPDADVDRARHRLSDALTELRNLLEPEGIAPSSVLEADHSGVCLRAPTVNTDLARLRLSLRGARQADNHEDYAKVMRIALNLYAGELLPSVYDDWVLIHREEIWARFRGELQRFIAKEETAGHIEDALELALTLLTLSQANDAVCEHVLRLYIELNRVDDAVRLYNAFRKRLQITEHRDPSRAMMGLMAAHGGRQFRPAPKNLRTR